MAELSVPAIIVDRLHKKNYQKGRYLGKGGSAVCYELIDTTTYRTYAGKIVRRRSLTTKLQNMLNDEIRLHRVMNHRNVVGFHSSFEDADLVYIVLELCRGSVQDLLNQRPNGLSEEFARRYCFQIIRGLVYIHHKGVIHGDLKPGNVFLGEDIKVGDFGMATTASGLNMSVCGTPNYLAPEIIRRTGHSYEVFCIHIHDYCQFLTIISTYF
jgi:polo-like kinase 1